MQQNKNKSLSPCAQCNITSLNVPRQHQNTQTNAVCLWCWLALLWRDIIKCSTSHRLYCKYRQRVLVNNSLSILKTTEYHGNVSNTAYIYTVQWPETYSLEKNRCKSLKFWPSVEMYLYNKCIPKQRKKKVTISLFGYLILQAYFMLENTYSLTGDTWEIKSIRNENFVI
jgi:hypothetical protein